MIMGLKYMNENLTNTQPEDETIPVWKIHVVARQLKIMLCCFLWIIPYYMCFYLLWKLAREYLWLHLYWKNLKGTYLWNFLLTAARKTRPAVCISILALLHISWAWYWLFWWCIPSRLPNLPYCIWYQLVWGPQ